MLYVKDFSGATDAEQIRNAIEEAAKSTSASKTVQLEENKSYSITSTIFVRKDVELVFGYGTKFVIEANVRVLELETNASVINPYIAIGTELFDSEVFYLDGKYKYYNTWNRTSIQKGVIVNWVASHKGTGLSLYSGGDNHEISFVNFFDIKISGLQTGIKLKANKPTSGNAWVNANRFKDISLEDCIEMVTLESSGTVPNECSGNMFSGLQIQPSSITQKILTVNGQQNRFEGMLWDLHLMTGQNIIAQLTTSSSESLVDFNGSLPLSRVQNSGLKNTIK
jgi:hypothetical protein